MLISPCAISLTECDERNGLCCLRPIHSAPHRNKRRMDIFPLMKKKLIKTHLFLSVSSSTRTSSYILLFVAYFFITSDIMKKQIIVIQIQLWATQLGGCRRRVRVSGPFASLLIIPERKSIVPARDLHHQFFFRSASCTLSGCQLSVAFCVRPSIAKWPFNHYNWTGTLKNKVNTFTRPLTAMRRVCWLTKNCNCGFSIRLFEFGSNSVVENIKNITTQIKSWYPKLMACVGSFAMRRGFWWIRLIGSSASETARKHVLMTHTRTQNRCC